MEDSQFLYTVLGNNAHGKLSVTKNSHRINRILHLLDLCWKKYKIPTCKIAEIVESKEKLL
jgi:hypothetical protein